MLFQYRAKDDPLPSKGPAVGLFADQEIRLLNGPLFVDQDYAAGARGRGDAAAAAAPKPVAAHDRV